MSSNQQYLYKQPSITKTLIYKCACKLDLTGHILKEIHLRCNQHKKEIQKIITIEENT